jgi:hypothetical protein
MAENDANPFYTIKNILSSKRPSQAADGNTIMNLPCLTMPICRGLKRGKLSKYV